MLQLSLKTASGDISAFKKIVADGISDERKKIQYALGRAYKIIKNFEQTHGMSSEKFLRRFRNGEIEETEDIFSWWAELKVSGELEEKLRMVDTIEICQ